MFTPRLQIPGGSGGAAGGGHTIQDEGVSLTQRTKLNFVGAGVAATDDAGNDATVVTIAGGGTTLPVADTTEIVKGSVDDTKKMRLEVDGLTPGATRVLTVQDSDGTIAITSNKLSAFASTTSAEFAGVISDEVGTGSVVLNTSPTFTTSILPTANDGTTIGAPTTGEFSDLYLAEGGVINWDNGDATITQVANMVTLAGADLTVPNITVGSGAGITTTHALRSDHSDGVIIEANNGTDVGILGAGNTANATWYGSHNYDTATQDTIAAFTGAGKTLGSLATATYPSLTELSYVKGVTSAVQTQINAKANDADVVHDTGDETVGGVKTFTSDPIIPDEAYGAGWNGSLEPPTKNAVYDKIQTMSSGGVSLGLVTAINMGYGGTFI